MYAIRTHGSVGSRGLRPSDPVNGYKITKFSVYIQNNKSRIVDYRKRKNNGFVFTSNLAESTVESLINKRCKGQQHMRWSRDGLDPLLQLRATIHSDEWAEKWRSAVLSAAV